MMECLVSRFLRIFLHWDAISRVIWFSFGVYFNLSLKLIWQNLRTLRVVTWFTGVGNDPREDRYFSIPKQVKELPLLYIYYPQPLWMSNPMSRCLCRCQSDGNLFACSGIQLRSRGWICSSLVTKFEAVASKTTELSRWRLLEAHCTIEIWYGWWRKAKLWSVWKEQECW